MTTTTEDAAPGRGRRSAASAGGKKGRLDAVREKEPDFVGKFEMAHHLQCHVGSLGEWIASGRIPPPWSRPGAKHPLWRRDHYEEFRRTGVWPRASFHARPT